MGGWLDLLLRGAPPATPMEELRGDGRLPPEFRDYYDRTIVPHLLAFEVKRIDALRTIRRRMLIGIPASVLLIVLACWLVQYLHTEKPQGILGGFILGIIGIWAWIFVAQTRYHNEVKSKIFPALFRYLGDFRYEPFGPFLIDILSPFKIVPHYERETHSDYISGTYSSVPLLLEQVELVRGSGKHRTTVFQGLIVLLDVGKRFTGITVIRRDAGTMGNWFTSRDGYGETVRLEDPVFEERYEVYSSDQVQARYLLTTSFMERLMQLEQLFDSKLTASFSNQKLLIMLPSTKRWFEPSSMLRPATFIEDAAMVLEQMRLLFQIVTILKLDDTTRL